MKWTKEKPIIPGYYWFKRLGEPTIVKISKPWVDLMVQMIGTDRYMPHGDVHEDGVWSGPIEEPNCIKINDLMIKPCPFCGELPEVGPKDPEEEGNAWGYVQCVNPKCPARPRVRDGEDMADDRGSDVYKKIAIERWNRRKS